MKSSRQQVDRRGDGHGGGGGREQGHYCHGAGREHQGGRGGYGHTIGRCERGGSYGDGGSTSNNAYNIHHRSRDDQGSQYRRHDGGGYGGGFGRPLNSSRNDDYHRMDQQQGYNNYHRGGGPSCRNNNNNDYHDGRYGGNSTFRHHPQHDRHITAQHSGRGTGRAHNHHQGMCTSRDSHHLHLQRRQQEQAQHQQQQHHFTNQSQAQLQPQQRQQQEDVPIPPANISNSKEGGHTNNNKNSTDNEQNNNNKDIGGAGENNKNQEVQQAASSSIVKENEKNNKPWNEMELKEKVLTLWPNERDRIEFEYPVINTITQNVVSLRKQDAIQQTLSRTREDLAKELPDTNNNNRFLMGEMDSDGDYDSDDVIQVNSNNKNTPADVELCRYKSFINHLPDCVVLDLGFLTLPICPAMDEWCSCPCSKTNKVWRERFNLDDVLKDDNQQEERGKKDSSQCDSAIFMPKALIDHLRKKGEQGGRRGRLHRVTLWYLEYLYRDWYKPGLQHPAFYDMGSTKYKIVRAAEMKANHELFNQMQEEINRKSKEAEFFRQQLEDHQKKLEEVSKDLAKITKEKQELTKKLEMELGLQKPPPIIVTDEMKKTWKESHAQLADVWKKVYPARKKKATLHVKMSGPMKTKFKLAAIFNEWIENECLHATRKRRGVDDKKTYLFADMEDSDVGVLLNEWKVVYSAIIDENAEDDGGVTRDFVTRLWKNLGGLKVGFVANLFTFTDDGFCVPTRDDVLRSQLSKDDGESLERAKKYYRAIGRIIAYCLWQNVTIAAEVMPSLYRNLLFRNLSPLDELYNCYDLWQHVLSLLPLNARQMTTKKEDDEGIGEVTSSSSTSSGLEDLLNYFQDLRISDSDDAPPGTPHERRTYFRNIVNELFVHDYSIAIEAIKDGMTFGGRVKPSLHLAVLPLEAVDYMFFAKQEVTLEDLKGVLSVNYNEDTQARQFLETQKLVLNIEGSKEDDRVVKGVLIDLFEECTTVNPNFVIDFVHFATGYKYIPAATDNFRITIEFNYEEAREDFLPRASTCTMEVILPAEAYDANMDTLREKLMMAIESTQLSAFQMQ